MGIERLPDTFADWQNLGWMLGYIVGIYFINRYLERLSEGHRWTGLFMFVGLVVFFCFQAFWPEGQKYIAWISRMASTIWVAYNCWYIYQYKDIIEVLVKNWKPATYSPIIEPISFLHKPTKHKYEKPLFLYRFWFQVGLVVAMVIGLMFIGFYKETKAIAIGTNEVRKLHQANQRQIKKVADTLNLKVERKTDTLTLRLQLAEKKRKIDSLAIAKDKVKNAADKAKIDQQMREYEKEIRRLQRQESKWRSAIPIIRSWLGQQQADSLRQLHEDNVYGRIPQNIEPSYGEYNYDRQ